MVVPGRPFDPLMNEGWFHVWRGGKETTPPANWAARLANITEKRKEPRNSGGPHREAKKFNRITLATLFMVTRLHTGFSTPVDNPITT